MKVWVVYVIYCDDDESVISKVVGVYKNEPSDKFMSDIGFKYGDKLSYVKKEQFNVYQGEF